MSKITMAIIVIIIVLTVGIGSWWYYIQQEKIPPEVPPGEDITNFEECKKAGYPVLETHPRQCKTPDGRVFTEKITDYYGSSTLGPCTTDKDCYISGCNLEICQSKNEEPLYSICMAPQEPTPEELGYKCKCQNQKCQWSR